MESTNQLESTRATNPFVTVFSTGEVGKYLRPSGSDASIIRFSDSPSDVF